MKNINNNILLFFLCLFFSCKPEEEPLSWPVSEPDYYTTINENSKNIICGVAANKYYDSLITMAFTHFTEDALYWSINVGPFLQKDQDIVLQKRIVGIKNTYLIYYGSCCVPPVAPWPDVLYYTYSILESDSMNNILSVKVDTLNKSIEGSFHATVVNEVSPFDTIYFQCDSFFCKYE